MLGLPVLVTQSQLASLAAVHDIILGLIVFSIGGSFRFKAIRKIGAKLVRISALEIGASALLAGLGTYWIGASPLEAAFLAVIAATTAPAATQMVMRESRSEGSLTDTILPLIGINNLAAIVGFILLKHYGLSDAPSFWKTGIQLAAPFGLANILAAEWPGPGEALQTVILASVVVFELVGPLFTHSALVNAGEVTVLNLLEHRSPVSLGEGLRLVVNQFQKALGISPWVGEKLPEDLQVTHVMRRNVAVLSHRAPFDEVVKTLGHPRYDGMPVVNDHDELVGVVKYADVADTLFDPIFCHLVVAAEIATDDFLRLTPDDTLKTAMPLLKNNPRATYLLVVAQKNPRKLVGIVSHNDLLAAQRHMPV